MKCERQREALERELDSFDGVTRREALDGLLDLVARGEIVLPAPRRAVNLHAHTFFSYNGYGFSPTCFAWKARLDGLEAGGVVDFDVLDAVDEFLEASARVGLKACAGLETRVYLPEFGDREINSPGEPGIAYHMGTGFVTSTVDDQDFLAGMKASAQSRNRAIVARVNAALAPVHIDYERDVLPLTPKGNATERHVCTAYDVKAREMFPEPSERAWFWSNRLGEALDVVARLLDDGPAFQGLIRSKTMKRGGAGYVQPEGPDFPRLEEVNRFILAQGAIPTLAWLDGTTAGEQAVDELFDLHIAHGAAAVNIIPDRNWNLKDPEQRKRKAALFHQFVEAARERDMPVLVGTEMNAYGQRFVDDFEVPEMAPLTDDFIAGAHILHAHTVLQKQAGLGYLSAWAKSRFASTREKNAFYREVGARLSAGQYMALSSVTGASTPESILDLVASL